MYYYIVDPQNLNQKEFERVQNQLYSCLSELKVSGEINRVTSLRKIHHLVDSAMLSGATTIIGVGYDSTLQEIINCVSDKDITIGYIPLDQTEVSKILGINDVVHACHTIAHRRIEILDLGKIQNNYFFTKVGIGLNLNKIVNTSFLNFSKFSEVGNMKPITINLEVDGEYQAQVRAIFGIVTNSRGALSNLKGLANPTDGSLDILFLPQISSFDAWKYRDDLSNGCLEKIPGSTVIHGKRIKISSAEDLPFYVDDWVITRSQANFEIIPRKVKMIVGRERLF